MSLSVSYRILIKHCFEYQQFLIGFVSICYTPVSWGIALVLYPSVISWVTFHKWTQLDTTVFVYVFLSGSYEIFNLVFHCPGIYIQQTYIHNDSVLVFFIIR